MIDLFVTVEPYNREQEDLHELMSSRTWPEWKQLLSEMADEFDYTIFVEGLDTPLDDGDFEVIFEMVNSYKPDDVIAFQLAYFDSYGEFTREAPEELASASSEDWDKPEDYYVDCFMQSNGISDTLIHYLDADAIVADMEHDYILIEFSNYWFLTRP